MIEIKRVLKTLAEKRSIFHSEADFQHALAWEIHQQWLGCSMRLEFKPQHLDKRIYVDIWTFTENDTLAIELKYKTQKLYIEDDKETFDLLYQGAQNEYRYDFLNDIQRLEQVVSVHNDISAYAILLTNDALYWKPTENQTVDADFRIHDTKEITPRKLSWRLRTSEGTMRGREKPVQIKSTYKLSWKDYSEFKDKENGKFRYLLVKI